MLLVFVADGSVAREQVVARRVLIIQSFGRDFAPYNNVVTAFREELPKKYAQTVEFYEASLEMGRFDGENRDRPLVDYLMATLDGIPPDLIVAICAPAAMFHQRHRESLFPGVPLLVVAADERRVGEITKQPHVAEVPAVVLLDDYLENMVQVLPDTEHVYMISGTAPVERFWAREMMKSWALSNKRLEFHLVDDLPFEEMLAEMAKVPAHSALFFGPLQKNLWVNFGSGNFPSV
jgi:hypothetical protein